MAGTSRLATAGTGDVLSGVIGAFVARGVDAARGRRPGRPRPRPGRRPGPRRGAGGRRPARPGRPTSLLGPRAGRRGGRRPVADGWRAGLGRGRPGRRRATTPRCCATARPAALCAVVKADGYGHGAVRRGPDRPRGRGRLAGRGPGGGGGGRCARPASRRRSCCCPSPRPRRWPRRVADRLTPTVYTAEGVAALARAAADAGPAVRST